MCETVKCEGNTELLAFSKWVEFGKGGWWGVQELDPRHTPW